MQIKKTPCGHGSTPLSGTFPRNYRAKVVKTFGLCKNFLQHFTFFGILLRRPIDTTNGKIGYFCQIAILICSFSPTVRAKIKK